MAAYSHVAFRKRLHEARGAYRQALSNILKCIQEGKHLPAQEEELMPLLEAEIEWWQGRVGGCEEWEGKGKEQEIDERKWGFEDSGWIWREFESIMTSPLIRSQAIGPVASIRTGISREWDLKPEDEESFVQFVIRCKRYCLSAIEGLEGFKREIEGV